MGTVPFKDVNGNTVVIHTSELEHYDNEILESWGYFDQNSKIYKLQQTIESYEQREAARERVLQQLEDKYVPEMAIQSTEVHLDTTS